MEVPYTPASVFATVLLLYSFSLTQHFLLFFQLVAISIGVLSLKVLLRPLIRFLTELRSKVSKIKCHMCLEKENE